MAIFQIMLQSKFYGIKYVTKMNRSRKKNILYKYNKEKPTENLRKKKPIYCFDKNLSCSEKAENLVQLLRESMSELKKEVESKEKENNKWYDKNLRELKRERDEAYRKTRNTNDKETWNKYKQIRNKYSKMIKKCSNNYTKNEIIECKGDSKKMWQKIKEIMNEKKSKVDKIEIISLKAFMS